jgi:hypothetical protein
LHRRCCRRANTEHRPEAFLLRAATSLANPPDTKVDFRYAPRNQQSTICFPDDPRKTIVGQAGDLRYGFAKSLSAGMENFGTVIEFSLAGFQDDKILRQWIESPAFPIVHTLIDRPVATFELIAFATRHPAKVGSTTSCSPLSRNRSQVKDWPRRRSSEDPHPDL